MEINNSRTLERGSKTIKALGSAGAIHTEWNSDPHTTKDINNPTRSLDISRNIISNKKAEIEFSCCPCGRRSLSAEGKTELMDPSTLEAGKEEGKGTDRSRSGTTGTLCRTTAKSCMPIHVTYSVNYYIAPLNEILLLYLLPI
jgi:hypothetical protein